MGIENRSNFASGKQDYENDDKIKTCIGNAGTLVDAGIYMGK